MFPLILYAWNKDREFKIHLAFNRPFSYSLNENQYLMSLVKQFMKKIIAKTIYKRILSFKIEHKHFLLAISGGPDSMLMLDVFFHLRKDYGIRFSVAHLNHQLRVESKKEQYELEKMFKKDKINYYIDSVDVESYKNHKKISLEMAAHELRYQFFDTAKENLGANIICTAHHQDDHIESILMNMFRGSGLEGLKGLNEYDSLVFKPLLKLSKSDILKYVEENNIKFFDDKSNNDIEIERNFWRHEIIHRLRNYFGDSFAKGFIKTIENLRWSKEDLNLFKKKLHYHLKSKTADGKLLLEINDLKEYLSQFLKRLLDHLISLELSQDIKLKQSDFKNIVRLIHQSETGKYIDISGQFRIEKSFDKLIIYKKKSDFTYLKIEAEKEYKVGNYVFQLKKEEELDQSLENSEFIAGDKLEFPLILKNVKLDEYFQPLGLKGRQKVNRFLKSNKVHQTDRSYVLALYNNNEIVSVLGLRISENYKITDQTKAKYKIIYKDI